MLEYQVYVLVNEMFCEPHLRKDINYTIYLLSFVNMIYIDGGDREMVV